MDYLFGLDILHDIADWLAWPHTVLADGGGGQESADGGIADLGAPQLCTEAANSRNPLRQVFCFQLAKLIVPGKKAAWGRSAFNRRSTASLFSLSES
jgi:hypothetical protein